MLKTLKTFTLVKWVCDRNSESASHCVYMAVICNYVAGDSLLLTSVMNIVRTMRTSHQNQNWALCYGSFHVDYIGNDKKNEQEREKETEKNMATVYNRKWSQIINFFSGIDLTVLKEYGTFTHSKCYTNCFILIE